MFVMIRNVVMSSSGFAGIRDIYLVFVSIVNEEPKCSSMWRARLALSSSGHLLHDGLNVSQLSLPSSSRLVVALQTSHVRL